MAHKARHRAWSFSDCPNLSECFGSSTGRTENLSKINETFHRVNTFSGDYQGDSLKDFVREAEIHAVTIPFSAEKYETQTFHPSPSYSRFRSLSHNGQCQKKRDSDKKMSPLARKRGCQSPPKVIFGQPIVSASVPTDCFLSSSPLANSLLIEYLALVTTDNPYGGLTEDICRDGESKEFDASMSPPSPSISTSGARNYNRKLGVVAGSQLAPPVSIHMEASDIQDGASGTSIPAHFYPHASSPFDPSSSSAIRRGRCDSSIYPPSGLDNFKLDEGARLKKLSTQVEVEQLRNMLHEFERTHLFKNCTKRASATGTSPELSKLQNQVALKNGQLLFNLNNISGLTPPKDPNIYKKATLEAPPTLKTNVTQVPVPGLGNTSRVSPPKPTRNVVRTQPISRLEHNIIAPLSF